jgi:formyltetrahydrofolate deformylase
MTEQPDLDRHLLLIDCQDQLGLVTRVTGSLFRQGLNIISNHEFVDRETSRFFMRTEFTGDHPADLVPEIQALLPPGASVRVPRAGKRRIVILVTREHHCLGELLLRHAYDELGATILAVIGNHATLAPLAGRFDIPFHHVSHLDIEREEHERRLRQVLERYDPDFLVLAKYMRVLGGEFVAMYPNRIINIHHSFLPAFTGAKPYHQAFERGVKIIGATAHFVTADLDEGPIIAQSVIPVDHSHSPADMAQAGRDVEKIVLASALRLVFEERVFLVGKRTIVFD